MPFKSASQRRLFWSAKSNPALRKKLHVNLSAVEKMTEHDTGGKLPEKVKKVAKKRTRKAKKTEKKD